MEDMNREESIDKAIKLLQRNGYIVRKDYSVMIGRWIAFRQDGMNQILHGKILEERGSDYTYFKVRCKNGEYRYPTIYEVIGFFNNKKSCYAVK